MENEMDKSNQLLSDIVFYRSYPRTLLHLNRRETYEETVNRCMTMHLDKFPKLSKDIMGAFEQVHDRVVLPSMRSLQFAGDAVAKNNLRMFNCSFEPIDNSECFGEILFLLLSGCGVGFSVEKKNVSQLPIIKQLKQEGIFIVQDSIAGWAQATDVLMKAYFHCRPRPVFDFDKISPKGTYLVSTGNKAPGYEALEYMLKEVERRLIKAIGRKLTSLEIHDIICIISDCVLAGGIRRSSLISLFDRDDKEMLMCKSGDWYIKHPYRARANNSAALPRNEVTKEEFDYIFKCNKESKSGEPGYWWTSSERMGTNPCGEAGLDPNQFCNLTTFKASDVTNKKDFMKRIHAATLIGTLQASYTDFPYVRDIWRENTERDALLGVSMTGVCDREDIPDEWLQEGAKYALEVNEKYAKKIGINIASRTTLNKPEGSGSCILLPPTASGIHAREAPYYLRRVRMSKHEALTNYLQHKVPDLMEDDISTANTSIITIPQQSPEKSLLRENETALKTFDRVKKYTENWIKPGHRKGENPHSVSCTIYVKEDEWDTLRERAWEDRDKYACIATYPFDGAVYKQAPFEKCSKEVYEEYMNKVKDIDLKEVVEVEDTTNRMGSFACSGGYCEIV